MDENQQSAQTPNSPAVFVPPDDNGSPQASPQSPGDTKESSGDDTETYPGQEQAVSQARDAVETARQHQASPAPVAEQAGHENQSPAA